MNKSIDIIHIKELIPQRYPFLMLDAVTEIVPGVSIKGFKNTTINEGYFQGHFPEEPVVPGVLIVEALAQLGSVLLAYENSEEKEKKQKGYLAGIKEFRFKRAITSGERIELEAKITEKLGNVLTLAVSAIVEGKTVAKGMLTVASK